jgi:23S rRNA (uracil1939-C5)-methyltransferase
VLFSGRDYIEEEMEGLRFRIGPKSFYQTNSRQAYELYKVARRMAHLTGQELVYDLYTGTGTIALFLADKCRRVVGIEYVEEAIADAKNNARINGYDNTRFYAGDMAQVLTEEFIAANGRPDVVVTDPPRAGMHEKVVAQLIATAPRKIVYVSCNPATQARDLQLLAERYEVRRIQPVDMFPHTQHVENIAELVLKS